MDAREMEKLVCTCIFTAAAVRLANFWAVLTILRTASCMTLMDRYLHQLSILQCPQRM